jgi:hypothetical protein
MNATQLSKPSTTHETSVVNKVRHFQDGIFRALKQARKHARGQPMMVEKFQEIRDLVEQLEGQGITSYPRALLRSPRNLPPP